MFFFFLRLTTDGNVTELHTNAFIQSETPGGLVFVPWVATVRVSAVQLRVSNSQVGVTVRVLGVPRLALTSRLGHADSSTKVCAAVVVTLVVWKPGEVDV